MSDKESPRRQRKRSYSNDRNSSDEDDRRSRKRRHSGGDSATQRVELRLLVHSKDAGSVIGKGGDNIKHLRMDYNAGVTISESRTPERVLIVNGDLEAIKDVCSDVFKGLEEKYSGRERRDFELTAKMLIHQSQAGCVIGKAGGTLKDFRRDYGVDIKVYSECCPRSTERLVQIIGKTSSVTKCVGAICKLLKEWPPKGMNNPYDPTNYDETMLKAYGGYEGDDRGRSGGRGRDRSRGRSPPNSRRYSGSRDRMSSGGMGSSGGRLGGVRITQQVSIPADLAGVIIGKGGARIKQIRQDSRADVELSDDAGPADRIITLTGTPEQIQNAQYMLQTSVKQHLARR